MLILAVISCLIAVSSLEPPLAPSQKLHTLALYGNMSLGYYYTTLFMGTPPQSQSLIVDTGSGIVAIPCEQCSQCGKDHISPKFSTRASSTSLLVTCATKNKACGMCANDNGICQFAISYSQGSSLKGILVEDYVVFPASQTQKYLMRPDKSQKDEEKQKKIMSERVKATFGCTTSETHLFLTQKADGILGMGPIRQSEFLESLFEGHSKFTKQKHSFALCLSNNGGTFTIGGYDPTINTVSTAVITKYNAQSQLYDFNISDFEIGGKSSSLQYFTSVFIDSGATMTYFPAKQFKSAITEIEKVCLSFACKEAIGEEYKCYRFRENQTLSQSLKRFPNISIVFSDGNKVNWTAQQYFGVRNEAQKEVCVTFVNYGRFILGATWMAGKNIYFNLENSTVEIFESAKCSPGKQSYKRLSEEQLKTLTEQAISIIQSYSDYVVAGVLIVVAVVFIVVMIIVFNEFREESNKRKKKLTIPKQAEFEKVHFETLSANESLQ